jgi:hypothetical protein
MPGGEDVRKVSRQDIQLVSTLMIPPPFSSFILLPSFFFLLVSVVVLGWRVAHQSCRGNLESYCLN